MCVCVCVCVSSVQTHSIENEVTDDDEINGGLTAQDREHVSWHSLPEVDQKVLYL